jgi:hypothetical protein
MTMVEFWVLFAGLLLVFIIMALVSWEKTKDAIDESITKKPRSFIGTDFAKRTFLKNQDVKERENR